VTGPVNNGDQLGGLKRPLLFVVQVLGAVPENVSAPSSLFSAFQ